MAHKFLKNAAPLMTNVMSAHQTVTGAIPKRLFVTEQSGLCLGTQHQCVHNVFVLLLPVCFPFHFPVFPVGEPTSEEVVGFAVQHPEIHAKGSLIEIMTEPLGSTVWRIE